MNSRKQESCTDTGFVVSVLSAESFDTFSSEETFDDGLQRHACLVLSTAASSKSASGLRQRDDFVYSRLLAMFRIDLRGLGLLVLEWNTAKFSRSKTTVVVVQYSYLAFAPVNGTNKRVHGISILCRRVLEFFLIRRFSEGPDLFSANPVPRKICAE